MDVVERPSIGRSRRSRNEQKKRAARKLQALTQDKEMRQPNRNIVIVPWVHDKGADFVSSSVESSMESK